MEGVTVTGFGGGEIIEITPEAFERLMGKEFVERTKREAEETAHLWCRCEFWTTPEGPEPQNPPTYHADGECSDCQKHHWHCGDCGKISQVG